MSESSGSISLASRIVEAVRGHQRVAIILIVAVAVLLLAAMWLGVDLAWLPDVLSGD